MDSREMTENFPGSSVSITKFSLSEYDEITQLLHKVTVWYRIGGQHKPGYLVSHKKSVLSDIT